MIFHPELLQISNVQRHPHHQQEPSFMETAQLIHTFIQWSYHMLHPLYFSLTILVEFQQKRANWCQLFVLLSSGPFVPSTSVSLDPSETCFIFCQGLRVKMIQNELDSSNLMKPWACCLDHTSYVCWKKLPRTDDPEERNRKRGTFGPGNVPDKKGTVTSLGYLFYSFLRKPQKDRT